MKNNGLLARGVTEFVVITVGVLVALAIDTAWDARQDRVEEQAYLAAILEELDGNVDNMIATLEAGAGAEAQLDRARNIMSLDAPSDSASEFIVSLIRATSFQTTPVLSRAVMQDLISTGNVRLIRDLEVRRELLQHDALSQALLGMVRRAEAEIESGLEPLVSRHIPPTFRRYRENADGDWTVVVDDSVASADAGMTAAAAILEDPALPTELNAEYRRIFEGQCLTEVLRRRLQGFKAELRAMIERNAA